MASSLQFILLSLLIFFSVSNAQSSSSNSKPKTLVLPIYKDASTLQYLTRLNLGTPSLQTNLVVDIGGKHLWIDCSTGYQSSTYRPGHCGSASCSVAKADCVSLCPRPASPGCNNNTCRVLAKNSIFGGYLISEVAIDTISLRATDGSKAGSQVSIPNFIFACAESFDLINLASGAKGMLGLAKERVSMPTQLSSAFGGSFRRKFAICLPSNSKANGVLFFGDSPYLFHPRYNTSKAIDVSSEFRYTKLHVNYETTASPRLQGAQLPEYFVKITSILVNQKPIPINSTLLEFHKTGVGGSRITTVQPYTTLETSIYKSLAKAFDEQMLVTTGNRTVRKVGAVEPFKDCYLKQDLGMSLLGIRVPDINLVFENLDVNWAIFGANSMVEVSNDVVCLGFVDRGPDTISTSTSIDIGAHQLQDNLLQFDLAASRLAFTSTLHLQDVECSNFKF
ncbi:probable aspartic proteinase GIP2 [Manihot esculenta]|uniref:Peptidase A1 domain-containing protein n=1 Tax=Manihot esculenta TaxID=3983 RepID=A0A2C9W8P2_MANES|nr:probable aspartic proteinase GIP2 [Manihot esculenta]OAY55836.1 hypothetical protein MANES_03G183500v8 [Manihot esculenta]